MNLFRFLKETTPFPFIDQDITSDLKKNVYFIVSWSVFTNLSGSSPVETPAGLIFNHISKHTQPQRDFLID